MSINTGNVPAAAGAPSPVTASGYDGTAPFTDDEGPPATFGGRVRAGVTTTIVAVPFIAAPSSGLAIESRHCLTGEEQRAATANGKTVPLAAVIHTLHRAPKDVIKAQLCQEPDRLIYKLTLLGRDGKVKRAIVDATNGAVVGDR